jgi:hypothetical protein
MNGQTNILINGWTDGTDSIDPIGFQPGTTNAKRTPSSAV